MKNFDLSQIETLDDVPHPHWVAIGNQLGGVEIIKALLRGEKMAEIKDVIRLLFDKNGRFIPFPGLKSQFCDPAPEYRVSQPEISLGRYLEDGRRFLPKDLADTLMSQSEFEDRVQNAKAKLEGDERTKNALKGPWFPIALPKLAGDYGAILDILVKAAKKAYEAAFPGRIFIGNRCREVSDWPRSVATNQLSLVAAAAEFPGRTFINYRRETLAKQTTIIPGTRHDRLVEAVKEKSQAGIFFLPFGGFSVEAGRETFIKPEFGQNIPDWLWLAGGWDTAMAYLAYSKVLCRNAETPIVRCTALNWQSFDYSLCFKAYGDGACNNGACGDGAYFDDTGLLADARGHYSAGALCLG